MDIKLRAKEFGQVCVYSQIIVISNKHISI
jgi:hypothetical protein